MTRRIRPARLAVAIWVLIAIVVWNGLYDLRITLGVRDYLLKAALHDAGRGPAVVMSDAMRDTVRDAVLVASLWGAIILIAGILTVRVVGRRAGGT
ncbi:MAG: hypothetical protein ACRD15_16580 [Vicinamibacterales bacterium]